MLYACNSLLVSIEEEFPVTGMRVDISDGELSLQLNGLFICNGVHGILQGKGHQFIDMVFPFICA